MALDPWVVNLLASLVFLSIGIILMFLESQFETGILAVGGVACVIIAILVLLQLQVPNEYSNTVYLVTILKYTITISCIVLGVFFGYIAYKGYQVRKLESELDPQSLIGKIGVAKTDIDPKGQVNVEGELWSAVCKQKPYAYEGEDVEIIGFEGLTLYVRPAIYKRVEDELAEEEKKLLSKKKNN
ncbi:MAG: NfeD family protein [Candidatus Jordarchaeaceae archaeon]